VVRRFHLGPDFLDPPVRRDQNVTRDSSPCIAPPWTSSDPTPVRLHNLLPSSAQQGNGSLNFSTNLSCDFASRANTQHHRDLSPGNPPMVPEKHTPPCCPRRVVLRREKIKISFRPFTPKTKSPPPPFVRREFRRLVPFLQFQSSFFFCHGQ